MLQMAITKTPWYGQAEKVSKDRIGRCGDGNLR
jgi:hypothetical protein